ncbi:cytochrome c [Marinobacter sp.]|uniref:c-type cytochrome n=1 Tax=Marinobacter sp. TaxID=50741 RepID=UPI0023570451|nr:cytochrome c [Marinobacter sp.]
MRIVYSIFVLGVVLALSGFAFIHSGVYNVTAMDEHSSLGKWALHTTMKNSVEARGSEVDVPSNLASEEMIRQGARGYDQLCVACHLKPGLEDTLLRQGLNPTPPSLTEAGPFGPGEQFWIIKNGIKMTGMPAWGVTHDDKDLWEITAFIQRLPSLSEAEYTRLVQPEPGVQAKADDGHDHDHGNMDGMMMMGESSQGESSHGAPGHHAMSGQDSAGHSEASGHHSEKEPKAASEPKADDHYADGHSH